MTQKAENLNEQMINDALIIINSVGFLERQINWNLALLEEAVNNRYDDDVPVIERRIRALLDKVGGENSHMDNFMKKYTAKVKHEEEAILSGIK
jgi:hypothetical protein